MQKTVILHKFWNLKKYFDHPGMIEIKNIQNDIFNLELCWLDAVRFVVLKNDILTDIWTTKTHQIEKLGYNSLGQLIIKNTLIDILDNGESYARLKIKFIFDSRTLQNESREKIDIFFKNLFRQMMENGIIKKEQRD